MNLIPCVQNLGIRMVRACPRKQLLFVTHESSPRAKRIRRFSIVPSALSFAFRLLPGSGVDPQRCVIPGRMGYHHLSTRYLFTSPISGRSIMYFCPQQHCCSCNTTVHPRRLDTKRPPLPSNRLVTCPRACNSRRVKSSLPRAYL